MYGESYRRFLPFMGMRTRSCRINTPFRLHAALDDAEVPNELHTVPGGGHGGFNRSQTLTIYETIQQFLGRHGLGRVVSAAISGTAVTRRMVPHQGGLLAFFWCRGVGDHRDLYCAELVSLALVSRSHGPGF